MKETKDEKVVREILQPFIKDLEGDFSTNLSNVFLIENDNLVLFEEISPKIYRGHYFFNSARGKEAKTLCKDALQLIFKKAEILQGWTPVEKRGAALLSRWLGFSSYGIINTNNGPCELFILTKNEWRKLNG